VGDDGPVRDVVILGSTGSIGRQALEIIAANPDRFRVVGLSCGGGNHALLVEQALEFEVRALAITDSAAAHRVREAIPGAQVISGQSASAELAAVACDVVLNGITGSVGLGPTLAALEAGTTVALANKESLVAGGELVLSRARPGQLVPVDSEHSAIAQCLRGGSASDVQRLILTASGGPFRGHTRDQLERVTPDEALKHPTWSMGPMVTTNSATLMNKGLELIEAHLLFGVPYERIDVVVHPQSVVHSMVEFVDGSTIAQASPPDMRLPISMGLVWPERVAGAALACDWTQATSWTFEPVDEELFPAIRLAREAGILGGLAPAVFNAANEEAVHAFLRKRLDFLAIVPTVAEVVEGYALAGVSAPRDVADVLAVEEYARRRAHEVIRRRS
jgi:1-deoxy-D-xylulose-5-phosphate reductoisomerase